MNPQYTINPIPYNLSKEETVIQMVELLDHLNSITQDIFTRVNKRLEQNTDKLSNISHRIELAASKLDTLKGDKKAKTVFSSSKYPAVDVNRDYVSIFKEPSKVERTWHEVKYSKYVSSYEPLSKLQFYHVKMPDQKNEVPTGLGDIPGDTKCINDLLLFNTGKNIYKDFGPGDSLLGPKVVSSKEHYTTSELGPAPLSLSQKSSVHQTNKDNYLYTPVIEELPALDVPFDLPDLPGIADDVRYEVDGERASIAPSALNNSQIAELDLPTIEEVKVDVSSSSQLPPPPPIMPEPPLMPPIVPERVMEPVKIIQSPVEVAAVAVISAPQPPPPPPPELTPSAIPPAPPVLVPPTTTTDSRSSLMDAIRKAGGSQNANLRKTNEQPQTKNSQSSASPGDLMADLHSKLMMRRKGISGAKKEEQKNSFDTADSAFARISSIIPPPSKDSDIGSGVSTDDEAWNDDDD